MNELVKINENNQVTTDSLTVADRFGKRHSDVLRSIKMLKCSKEFGERNFALSSYITEQGKEQPYYDMTYDGWMFLVMGFTGEKAAEWKEKFIKAFRAMEAVVRENRTTENNIRTAVRQELAVLTSESATDTDMQDMRNLLAALITTSSTAGSRTGTAIWSMKTAFYAPSLMLSARPHYYPQKHKCQNKKKTKSE